MLVCYYKVQPGDSLQGVADAHGVPVESVAAASSIQPGSPLRPGQVLRIPAPGHELTPRLAAVPARTVPKAVAPAVPPLRRGGGPGQVLLVIDQSYGVANLPALIRLLDESGARASWFPTGEWATKHITQARMLAARRGDLIGNHTWSHRNLRELPPAQLRDEITRGRDAIAQSTGVRPSWLRPPFGQSNERVAAVARQLGQRIVACTIDSLDWHSFGPKVSLERIVRAGLDGAVISLHGGADHAPAVLAAVLREVARQRYRTATVDALLT